MGSEGKSFSIFFAVISVHSLMNSVTGIPRHLLRKRLPEAGVTVPRRTRTHLPVNPGLKVKVPGTNRREDFPF